MQGFFRNIIIEEARASVALDRDPEICTVAGHECEHCGLVYNMDHDRCDYCGKEKTDASINA